MGYLLVFIFSLVVELLIIISFLYFSKLAFYFLWHEFKLNLKFGIRVRNAYIILLMSYLLGCLLFFVYSMPKSYKDNSFDEDTFERFEGLLYDDTLKNRFEKERQIQALFASMLQNPNKIKYIDMRVLNPDKEDIPSYGVKDVDYNNEDFKFYRVTYTKKTGGCEEKTNEFRKLLPNHFSYLDSPIKKAIFIDKAFCFSVIEIAANKASSFEFMPRKSSVHKEYMYFPPFFHTKSWVFSFISPTNREKYNIYNYQDVDQVYIYSHFNGVEPGTFLGIWGWALPGSSDLGLINRFLEDYVD